VSSNGKRQLISPTVMTPNVIALPEGGYRMYLL